ncbi:ATP-binding cassette domain-containing protein [Deinococcus daejeonensis]
MRDGLSGGARVGHVQWVRHDAGLRGEVGRDGLAVRGEHPRAPRGAEGRDIQTLSGGEQQRVHLARTLAQLHGTPGDRVLLLDEPTASLDLAHQHATLRLARDLCAEGVGVLAVLHDLNLAAQYADRVLLLDGGQVLTCAPPDIALTSGHIRAAYGHDVLVTRHPCLDCPLIVSAG